MHRRLSTMILLLLVTVVSCLLAGCSDEPRELTIHEPGEYKGTIDPLIAKGQHPELNHRLIMIQSDR